MDTKLHKLLWFFHELKSQFYGGKKLRVIGSTSSFIGHDQWRICIKVSSVFSMFVCVFVCVIGTQLHSWCPMRGGFFPTNLHDLSVKRRRARERVHISVIALCRFKMSIIIFPSLRRCERRRRRRRRRWCWRRLIVKAGRNDFRLSVLNGLQSRNKMGGKINKQNMTGSLGRFVRRR